MEEGTMMAGKKSISVKRGPAEPATAVKGNGDTAKVQTAPKGIQELQHALSYAENIIATLREPFVVLDKSLRVHTANAAFYRDFHVSKEETEGRFVYDLGNGQWDKGFSHLKTKRIILGGMW
jgi:hypothetical protein